MLFNSFIFLLFAAVFFWLWPAFSRRKQSRWLCIIVASFLFYGWWNWRYVFLLIFTGLVDYAAALGMQACPLRKRPLLILSLGSNLLTLFAFKYLGFFTENLRSLLHLIDAHIGVAVSVPIVSLVLPIGISFYTFQSMSYTIDVYRGDLKPTRNVFHFFASLSMFPHLVAGPIMRASVLLPQLEDWRSPESQKRWDGLMLIAAGYFKKMVLADNLAPEINRAFNNNVFIGSAPYWWVIITMFAFQIYFDFSGYSDIARGLAKWMGYEFSLNFNRPYLASGFRDFWTRWHISLSSWFRDYVYIPLGGSREGELKAQRNLWITMLLSGFWHGAHWTYIVWGALHAFYLQLERWTQWPDFFKRFRIGPALISFLLLAQVWVAWVFFRATSIRQALHIVGTMLNPGQWQWGSLLEIGKTPLVFLVVAIISQTIDPLRKTLQVQLSEKHFSIVESASVGLLLIAALFLRGPGNKFIYFSF